MSTCLECFEDTGCTCEQDAEIKKLKAKVKELEAQVKGMQHYNNCSHGKYHQIEGWYCNVNKVCRTCGDRQPKEEK